MTDYDCVVVGLGCSGLSTLEHLSRQDVDTLGIDMHGVPNDIGSSHGKSRIFRLSYYEGEEYLPLLEESYKMWKKQEKETGRNLLRHDGFLFFSDGGSQFESCKDSCVKAGIDYELLSSSEINNRFNGWNVPSNVKAVYHKKGGVLKSRQALLSMKDVCNRNSVDIKQDKVENVNIKENSIKLHCHNTTYTTNKLVVATGPWAKSQFNILKNILELQKHQFFFQKGDIKYTGPSWISYINENHSYGMSPVENYSHKLGSLGDDTICKDMNEFHNKNVNNNETMDFLKKYFNLEFRKLESSVCPITKTPDDDYIIDFHPSHDNIIFCCGMSGHGFKTANINGKIAADLVTKGYNKFQDIFQISRFH